MYRLAVCICVLSLLLSPRAHALTTWEVMAGPVSESASDLDHIGTDGASLYVVFNNNQLWRYSFSPSDPTAGSWTRLADPARLVCGSSSNSDLAYQDGYLYTSAINSSNRVLIRYQIATDTWEVWRDGNIDIIVCKTTGNGMFMDPLQAGVGYSASGAQSRWVRFDWDAQAANNDWMSTSGLGVTDADWVSRNEDMATDGSGTYYATKNDTVAGLSGGDVIYTWQGVSSPVPSALIQKPWQAGFGQSLEFVPSSASPSGHDELWLLRGADGSADPAEGYGSAASDWARLDLADLQSGWSLGNVPGVVGYNGEMILVGSTVFVRGEGAEWYVPRVRAPNPVAQARDEADGTAVEIEGVTSAVFAADALFYIQSPLRSCGIQVRCSGGMPLVGQHVVVDGTMATDAVTGERCIQASGWAVASEYPVEPLAMGIRNLGGDTAGLQQGVYQGVGLNNVGLLARVCGAVTGVAADKSYVYLSDGSGVNDGNPDGWDGVRVDLGAISETFRPPLSVGDMVAATGVSTLYSVGGESQRLVRARSAEDVLNYSDDGNRPKVFKVMVINFDPIIEYKGNKRLHAVYWPTHDPRTLAQYYINDLLECSHGWAQYEIVEWVDADYFPIKIDGFQYTDQSFCTAWESGGPFHSPDGVDYYKVVSDKYYDYNNPRTVVERVAAGEIDEVFMFGAPYFGYWESCMVGPSPYFVNGGTYYVPEAGRNFIVMGFNYERWVGEMLEDYGHRSESIMRRVYGSWNAYPPQHNWDLFTLVDKNIVDHNLYTAGCGNVHYAPNSTADYEWGNPTLVWSTCDDWLNNWPNLQGTKRLVNYSEWGYGDIRAHHKWWLKHFPHTAGINPDGKQNNWWKYLADYNSYPESR